jgi:hypothetical protein
MASGLILSSGAKEWTLRSALRDWTKGMSASSTGGLPR